MKLIIEVGEEDYHRIASGFGQEEDALLLEKIFKNGIPLDEIRDEIDRLHYHPKLDFIKNDEVVDMALDIINKYTKEQTE